MEELPFKIVKLLDSRDEVIARVENFLICKAAFEKALFVYPDAHLEMRQGARIILSACSTRVSVHVRARVRYGVLLVMGSYYVKPHDARTRVHVAKVAPS
jgi:hypothetical protein